MPASHKIDWFDNLFLIFWTFMGIFAGNSFPGLIRQDESWKSEETVSLCKHLGLPFSSGWIPRFGVYAGV
jgi:hypothetical protein